MSDYNKQNQAPQQQPATSKEQPKAEPKPVELPKPNQGETLTFNEKPIELPKPNTGETVTKGG